MSDGLRINRSPQAFQEDQALSSADRGKIEQENRKSATSRNQNSGSQDSRAEDDASDKEREA